jgi:hypothetical protein
VTESISTVRAHDKRERQVDEMDKKVARETPSLYDTAFDPGENRYLSEHGDDMYALFDTDEVSRARDEEYQSGDEYTFLYWQ